MTDMNIKATVDGWDNLSNDAKSLVNFFMKDARLRLDNKGSALVGNIISDKKLFCFNGLHQAGMDDGFMNDANLYALSIPYANYPYTYNSVVGYYPNIYPDTLSTLTSKTSQLTLCHFTHYSDWETDQEYWKVISDQTVLSNDIALDAYIGSTVNTDSSAAPASVPVDATIDLTHSDSWRIDFQLKSESFRVAFNNGNNSGELYYKLGVYPFGANTVEGLVTSLKQYKLCYGYSGAGIHEAREEIAPDDYRYIMSYSQPWTMFLSSDPEDSDKINFSFCQDGFGGSENEGYDENKFITRAIFPIVLDGSSSFRGLAYIELYDSNDDPFTPPSGDPTFNKMQIKQSNAWVDAETVIDEDAYYTYNFAGLALSDIV